MYDKCIYKDVRQILWRTLVVVALMLAVIGVALPGLPTTPFLLVAAWGGSRGWPRLEAWLLAHPAAGPSIQRWRERRAVPRVAKWLATAMMGASLVILAGAGVHLSLVLSLALLMSGVGFWLWRCPDE